MFKNGFIFKPLIILIGIVLFLIIAVISYQSSKLKVSVCDFDNENICSDGEATADLNRVLIHKDGEVLKFSHCDINSSKGACTGKSDKTNKTQWKIKITNKSNFNIHSNYSN